MQVNLPPKVRLALYIATAVLTPVVGYLFDKGHIGQQELALWGAEVTVISILAAFNTNTNK